MGTPLPTRGVKRKTAEHGQHDHHDVKIKIKSESPESSSEMTAEAAAMNPLALADLSSKFTILPVPDETDGLKETADKLEGLANVVKEGNSLALWTGLKLSSSPHARDPELLARSQMGPLELESYNSWLRLQEIRKASGNPLASPNDPIVRREDDEAGATHHSSNTDCEVVCQLPEFDWTANVAPVPQGNQSLKKFSQRAAAMDIVWDHQGATPENAAWLTFHMIGFLPLVKAVTKVMNMRRHFQENDPYAGMLTNMEVAELETVRKIIVRAEQNKNREMEKIHRMAKSIHRCVEALNARLHSLEKSG